MRTKQYARNGLLLEQMGSFAFGFELQSVDQQLQMNFKRQYCMGIPLPKLLSLQIDAKVNAIDEYTWETQIELSLMGITIVQYGGEAKIMQRK